MRITSGGRDTVAVRKSLTAGYFANAAVLAPHGGGPDGSVFHPLRGGGGGGGGVELRVHPGSVLFRARPRCVVFAAAVRTEREYMRDVTAVEPEWLAELAPHFYQKSHKRVIGPASGPPT